MVSEPTYHSGHLEWYGCSLDKAADSFGTPLHVGCDEAVRDSVNSFRQQIQAHGVKVSIYYSVKTNPLPAFLNRIKKEGCGFEIVNTHEAQLLKKLDVSPEKIIMTGIPDPDNPVFALEDYHLISVSTIDQLCRLAGMRGKSTKKINVSVTITPKLWRSYWDISLNTSRRKGPVGVDPFSAQFDELLMFISKSPELKLEGLHMHLGSSISGIKPYLKGIKTLEKAALKASMLGLDVKCLNIGGGYSLNTAPMLKVRNIVTSLLGIGTVSSEPPDPPEQLKTIGRYLTDTTNRLRKKAIHINEIAAEPGRILSGPCQLMILTVEEVISRYSRHHYLVCDGGAMSLSPMFLTEKHRILALSEKSHSSECFQYEVSGPLPTSLDRLSSGVLLRKMKAGDRIAILDTGAYILPMNNHFMGSLPAVAWIEQCKVKLVRERHKLDEIYLGDIE